MEPIGQRLQPSHTHTPEPDISARIQALLNRVGTLKVASALTFNTAGERHANAVAQRDNRQVSFSGTSTRSHR
jgi:hypothetical protein